MAGKVQRHKFYSSSTEHPRNCTMKSDYGQGICWEPVENHISIPTKINPYLRKARAEIAATMTKDRDVALALAKQNYDWSNDHNLSVSKRDEYAIQRLVWEARAEALTDALRALERHTDDRR